MWRARIGATLAAAVLVTALLLVTSCGAPGAAPGASSQPSTATPTPPAPSPTVSVDRHAPPGFIDMSDVDSSILTDIRYHTPHNFVGRPIAGYLEPRCLLARETAAALHRAQVAAQQKGYSLKVYDCYRPARAGEDFAAWAKSPGEQATKGEFFPDLTKVQLFTDGFVGGGRTSHSSGTAVDLTLVAVPTPTQRPYVPGEPLIACTAADRFPDNSVDMGTGFDCFDARSHTLDPRITGTARANRLLLRQFMTEAGFVNYANEWWHYDLVNGPFQGIYFDFPVAREALR